MASWLGPAISAGSSILGGILGKKRTDSSLQLQRDALKKGIQWKVADARKAGIHPLYALGAQTNMPSFHTGSALGDGIAEAGRAVGSYVGGKAAAANQERRTEQAHQMSLREAQQRINKDIVQQQLLASQLKREEARANITQDNSLVSGNRRPAGNLRMAGIDVRKNPEFSDAQDVEDRYSEIVAWPYGAATLAGDVWSTWKNKYYSPTMLRNAKRKALKNARSGRYKHRSDYRHRYR